MAVSSASTCTRSRFCPSGGLICESDDSDDEYDTPPHIGDSSSGIEVDEQELDAGYKASSEPDSGNEPDNDLESEVAEAPDLMPLRAISRHLVSAFLELLAKDAAIFKDEAKEQSEVVTQCLKEMYGLQEEEQDEQQEKEEKTADSETAEPRDGDGEEEGEEKECELRQDLSTSFTLEEVWQASLLEVKINSNRGHREESLALKDEGNNMLHNGLFEDAVVRYKKAEALDPSNPAIYCNRAAAYNKLWKSWEAVSDCAVALALNPRYVRAIGRLGCAYARLGQVDLAQRCYEKAHELDPDATSHQDNLDIIRKFKEEEAICDTDPAVIAKSIASFSGLVGLFTSSRDTDHACSE